MKRILWHRPSPGTVFGLAALVVAIGGVAFATIPDSSGTIHGCYDRRGTLRVIDTEANPPQTCRSRETPLTWNQEGPPGPPGSSNVRSLNRTTIGDGESRVLLAEGALTFTGRCELNVPVQFTTVVDLATIVVSTTEDHSAFGVNTDLNPSTPLTLLESSSFHSSDSSGTPSYSSQDFTASAPGGTDISSVLYAGVNALGQTGKCVFGGFGVVG